MRRAAVPEPLVPPEGVRPLRLVAPGTGDEALVTGQLALRIGQDTCHLEITVPAGPVTLDALLPVFHGLSDGLVELAEAREIADGRRISCGAACGACCRQAVPIAPSEARGLALLVAAMPSERRAAIRDRFRHAAARLAQAGVETATDAASQSPEAADAFGAAYRTQGVACPFLEAESCSIHRVRPAACREYLVTTPALRCGAASLGGVRSVPLSGHVSLAVLAVDRALEGHGSVLLVDALDWAAAHLAPPPSRSGPELIEAVFARLAEQLAAAFALVAAARAAAQGLGAMPGPAIAAEPSA